MGFEMVDTFRHPGHDVLDSDSKKHERQDSQNRSQKASSAFWTDVYQFISRQSRKRKSVSYAAWRARALHE
jgi:hypothetical protein